METVIVYNVFKRDTGELIATGSSNYCSMYLGITQVAFWSMVRRSKRGIGKYVVEKAGNLPWRKMCAKQWDDSFSWLRDNAEKVPYPCTGCMKRAICEFSDTYCEKWAKWYAWSYNQKSTRIRNAV